MHSERQQRLDQQRQLAAAGDWHKLYQRTVLYEFPTETMMGFQLAFLRTFADPDMAKILIDQGRILKEPAHRAYDTGIVIYELIANGLDNPRARQFLTHMNRAHHGAPAITAEQMSYVLAAFAVAPARHIDSHGWREQLPVERQAAAHFYTDLGALMGIKDRFATYEEAEAMFDSYEDAHMGAATEDSLTLAKTTLGVLAARLPRPARPFTGQLLATQLADPAVAASLGLPEVGRAAAALDRAITATRRRVVPRTKPSDEPTFTPGQPSGTAYPDGYTPEQITRRTSNM